MNKSSSGIAAAQKKIAEMRASGVKIVRLDPIEKAKANPKSARAAITGKCWECCGGGADGSSDTKWQIGNCLSMECPLRPLRPYQNLEGKEPPAAFKFTYGIAKEALPCMQ